MIKLFNSKQDCCGCTACKSICPEQAISMLPDEEGFLYPEINCNLCVECGLCKKVCAFQNGYATSDNYDRPKVYALKHKSDEVRKNSSSGGAFTAISDYILSKKGVIYGVAYDENFYVEHQRAETAKERNKFRGSKYVQSDLKEVFSQINEDLKKDRYVLFTGTGCQVAGLIKYLDNTQTDAKKLITNDIICHGAPSPLLWNKYLKFIQREDEITSYTFRYKEKGWHGYNVKGEFKSGRVKINTSDIKIYANLFGSDLALRPSCYNCQYTNLQRPSDITIGDFWGIEKTMPEIDDNKGISLVLINTPKGKGVIDKIKGELELWESNTRDCLQLNLQQPTKRPKNRDRFWEDYHGFGFAYIAKKYAGYSFIGISKRVAVIILKRLRLLELMRKIFNK